MQENELNRRPERHPVVNIILILLVVGMAFIFVGPFIGMMVALPFYPGSMQEMFNAFQRPAAHPEVKTAIYIMQGFATFVGLILAPAWLLVKKRTSLKDFFRHYKFEWIPVLVTVVIVVVFMGVNSVFIEWNANFTFPGFAREFENWARQREDAAGEIVEFLTRFESPAELLVALLVIAVLPAVGEEIVFRGLIQNEIYRGTKNIHLSIWIAAIIFSAFHIQFFGFVPRMLLGAMFGYLYYWSGNLTLAIIAHFVNNGVSLLVMYFYQQGAFDYDFDNPEAAPMGIVIMSALGTAGLLYYFYQYFEHRKPAIS